MMLKMELPGKRKRGRSKIKFMEFQKEVQKNERKMKKMTMMTGE